MERPLTIAHTSDWHLGLRQFDARSRTGRNLREQDIGRAASAVASAIADSDADIVIHAGDVYEAPVVALRWQVLFQQMLVRMSRRPDGRLRPVIVISGNHDQPSDMREPAAINLDSVVPGAHIVTSGYSRVHLGDHYDDPAYRNVVIHAIPHDALRTVDWETVTCVDGAVNILTSHGVVGGSDLYKRSKHREFPIPTPVLAQPWDYVAMGHWHKRGPVPVGAHTARTTPVWYCGSPENNDFGEAIAPDGAAGRGWLEVEVTGGGAPPKVTGHDLPIRPMLTLPDIDAAGMAADDITAAMVAAVSDPALADAVVRQRIVGVTRDEWHLVDVDAARKAASATCWYEIVRIAATSVDDPDAEAPDTYTSLTSALDAAIGELCDDDTDPAAALASELLGAALATVGTEKAGDTPDET